MDQPNQTPNGKAARNGNAKGPRIILLAVAVVVAAVIGVRHLQFAHAHVATDNAYLTADVVQISPQVAGTVKDVLVHENQVVKKGDLLVVLDDAMYKAAVAQRQADLDAAVAQAKGAGFSVDIASQTGSAQMLQAEGMVQQADSSIAGANADVVRAESAVGAAKATASGAKASIGNAQAAVDAAVANKSRYADAVDSAQALLESAQAGVRAAQAVSDRADHEEQRYIELAKKGAVSSQRADDATAAALTAEAQLEGAKAMVVQRQADLAAAKQQLNAAGSAIGQANAQLAVAREQAQAAQEGIGQAAALKNVSEQNVRQATARRQQAAGQLEQAGTGARQVNVSKSAQATAVARIEQARAALDAATLQLNYARIYAPADGRVSNKTAEVGLLVSVGTPLMALIPSNSLWVVANFKETQLAKMDVGDEVEVRADALKGVSFRGSVDSLSPATGATFALLPPDNATGNFTKVVQRVPVKIVLDPGQKDLDRLRAGLSVVAIVKTK